MTEHPEAPDRIWVDLGNGADRGGWGIHRVFPQEEIQYLRLTPARAAAEQMLKALKNINLTFDSYGKERLPEYVRKEFAQIRVAIAAAQGGEDG